MFSGIGCPNPNRARKTLVEQSTLYPLEFFVAGTPISSQSSNKSKERWKEIVANAARARARETDELGFLDPDLRPTSVTIYYFLPHRMPGDIDNIVKPILDAMIRIAYVDDRAVERLVVQKFEPAAPRDFADPSLQLVAALDFDPPVVYIRIDDDLSWRRL
jgi:Holliday junction resolvase RusA-like endonuclease